MQKLKNNEPWPKFTGSYKKQACIFVMIRPFSNLKRGDRERKCVLQKLFGNHSRNSCYEKRKRLFSGTKSTDLGFYIFSQGIPPDAYPQHNRVGSLHKHSLTLTVVSVYRYLEELLSQNKTLFVPYTPQTILSCIFFTHCSLRLEQKSGLHINANGPQILCEKCMPSRLFVYCIPQWTKKSEIRHIRVFKP